MQDMKPSSSRGNCHGRRKTTRREAKIMFRGVKSYIYKVFVFLVLVAAIFSDNIRGVDAQAQRAHQGELVQMCDEKCKSCKYFDAGNGWQSGYHCVECEKGHELWFDGCYPPCPPGEDRFGQTCETCTNHCETCAGPGEHDCVKCVQGYEKDFRGLCALSCPEGRYYDSAKDQCLHCNSFCKTCIGKYQNACTSCPQGYIFRPMFQFSATDAIGTCVESCEEGFYKDQPTELRCTACSLNCKCFC